MSAIATMPIFFLDRSSGALDRGRWFLAVAGPVGLERFLPAPGPQGARPNISHIPLAAGPLERCWRPCDAVLAPLRVWCRGCGIKTYLRGSVADGCADRGDLRTK